MTIKEAQELVDAYNEKNSIHNSELISMAIIMEKAGELASAIARKQAEPTGHHPDAPYPPLTDEIADMFWELLGLCSHSGVDMTEGLLHILELKNSARKR